MDKRFIDMGDGDTIITIGTFSNGSFYLDIYRKKRRYPFYGSAMEELREVLSVDVMKTVCAYCGHDPTEPKEENIESKEVSK